MNNYEKRFIEIQFYALVNQFYFLQGIRDFKNVQELVRFSKVLAPELDLETIQDVINKLDLIEHRPTKAESIVVCIRNNVSGRAIKEIYRLSGTTYAKIKSEEYENPMYISATFNTYEVTQMNIVLKAIKGLEEFGICEKRRFRTFSSN